MFNQRKLIEARQIRNFEGKPRQEGEYPISLNSLSKLSGIHPQRLWRWENCLNAATAEGIGKIAKCLDIKVSFFYSR